MGYICKSSVSIHVTVTYVVRTPLALHRELIAISSAWSVEVSLLSLIGFLWPFVVSPEMSQKQARSVVLNTHTHN